MIRLTRSAAICLVFAAGATLAADLTGNVVAVPDGDTISVRTANGQKYRVRLDGIDAPERTQPYSQVSRRHLSDLVEGKAVLVVYTKTDKYGRLVGIVSTNAVADVGLEQIKAGLAWHFKRYEQEQTPENRAAYAAAETIAKAAMRGLWRGATPEPPWEFRARAQTPAMEGP